jgi:hypothetical protein
MGQESTKRASMREIAISLAAQIMLVLSGGMFLCGYAARAMAAETFGLPPDIVQPPIGETIADGYVMVAVAVMIGTLVYMVAYLVTAVRFVVALRRHAPVRRANGRGFKRFGRENFLWVWHRMLIRRLPRRLDPMNGPFAVTAVCMWSVIIGLAAGGLGARQAIGSVNDGCRSECFVYLTNKNTVIGRPIAGDKDRLFILSRGGVMVIPIGDLRQTAAYPYGASWQPF